MGSRFNFRSLPVQMMLSFGILVIATTLFVGIPAIWLSHGQLDRQAWTQIEQGVRATKALYLAQGGELTSLAKLTAQRPTLKELLIRGDREVLIDYLRELQGGANLDLIAVCGKDGQVIASTNEAINNLICNPTQEENFVYDIDMEEFWLVGNYPISSDEGRVFVGLALNDSFASQMYEQTGLEQSIFWNEIPLATSLDLPSSSLDSIKRQLIDEYIDGTLPRTSFTLERITYYSVRFPIQFASLEAEVAVDVNEINNTRQKQIMILLGSMVGVATLAMLAGVLLARKISRPLVDLSNSVTQLEEEELDIPFHINASLKEVSQLAQAFEKARLSLKETLTTLQQQRDWTNQLVESIVEGILTLDHEGRINYFSAGAEGITGWQREEVLRRALDEVFQLAESDEDFSSQLPAMGEKRVLNLKLANRRSSMLAVTVASFLPPGTESSQIALVFRDVSEEQAVSRLLGQFLSSVAHEFRTPLSAVSASAELLEDQFLDLDSEQIQELITSLRLGILGLETLVDNLLESASIEARRFRVSPRPSNVQEMVAEATNTMSPLLEKHRQRLEILLPENLPSVNVDPRRTIQVMINLLSNAIKYGPTDSIIEIKAEVIDTSVRISVSDSGPGVSKEYRQDIFIRFMIPRIDDEKAKPGAGLGLSVVKAIVEAQGGQVGVTERIGGGATFWFTMPERNEAK